MTPLRFDSLGIKQFRSFRNLEIKHLGQVNLITGKNSVGKTALLEALRVSADAGSPRILRQLLLDRDELYRERSRRHASRDVPNGVDVFDAIKNLFHGRLDLTKSPSPIVVGPLSRPAEILTITPIPLVEEIGEDRVRRFRRTDQISLFEQSTEPGGGKIVETRIPGLDIRLGTQVEQVYPLLRVFDGPLSEVRFPSRFPIVTVSAQGLTIREISALWQEITLTSLEDHVVHALNIVSPVRVVGINIVGDTEGRSNPTVIARVLGSDYPLPLKSLGEGVSRAFGLALALVNAKNGLLLVDEIDSGLHFAVQFEMWKLILTIAKQLDIQVFATTHSWDCVVAFQQAVTQNMNVEGVLVRLERKQDDVVATLFSEEDLAIATHAQIEVR